MRQSTTLVVALLATASVTGNSAADEGDLSNRDEIHEFIENNLIGRTLLYTYEGNIANDTIFTKFHRKKTFTDLKRSKRGLSFKIYAVIEQKNWDLDNEGKRVTPKSPRAKDRVLSTQTAVTQRNSTGELIGFSFTDGNSIADSSGSVQSARLGLTKLEDGTPALRIEYRTVLYEDHFAKAGSWRPGVSHSTELLFRENGKLVGKYSSTSYSVDADTLRKDESSRVRTDKSYEREPE